MRRANSRRRGLTEVVHVSVGWRREADAVAFTGNERHMVVVDGNWCFLTLQSGTGKVSHGSIEKGRGDGSAHRQWW
jgi:hypothetical protein